MEATATDKETTVFEVACAQLKPHSILIDQKHACTMGDDTHFWATNAIHRQVAPDGLAFFNYDAKLGLRLIKRICIIALQVLLSAFGGNGTLTHRIFQGTICLKMSVAI